jgi:hypothetical protein
VGAVLSFSKLLLAAVNGPAVGRCHMVPAAAESIFLNFEIQKIF